MIYIMSDIHGPFPGRRPAEDLARPNGRKIGIDCGSGYPAAYRTLGPCGRLACLRLDDIAEFYSEE